MALVPGSSSTDPRTLAPAPADEGVGPVVALPRQGLPKAVLIGFAIAAALILFVILESRRRSNVEVAATAPQAVGTAAPAPPLIVPGPVGQPQMQMQPQPQIYVQPQPQARFVVPPAPAAPRYRPPPAQIQPQVVYVPQQENPVPQIQQAAPARTSGAPALVIDTTAGDAGPAAASGAAGSPEAPVAAAGGGGATIAGTRSRAGSLANRTTTVAQGTLIPAVMETAFNSNRPGLARAIVSSDIRGFDGSRVLIQRGSRLIGEYRTDTRPGQRRALVNWVRLIRPDGVTIAIGSPSTDTLGRAGIKANVDTHFFQRFAGALLRSTVDLGLTLAAGAANTPLVVVPGSGGGVTQGLQPADIPPTLTVRPGASISVFVARDLDFTGSERRR
ncbi:MAG TPA: TrbI/VirB10 family protein [Allosphingosinicella sp.]|nr:TrbI/VirB10 family protein [Allosphingosinicella sp.]